MVAVEQTIQDDEGKGTGHGNQVRGNLPHVANRKMPLMDMDGINKIW